MTVEETWTWDRTATPPALVTIKSETRYTGSDTVVVETKTYEGLGDAYRITTCQEGGGCGAQTYRGPYDYVGGPSRWVQRALTLSSGAMWTDATRTLDANGQVLTWSHNPPPVLGDVPHQETWTRTPAGVPLVYTDDVGSNQLRLDYTFD